MLSTTYMHMTPDKQLTIGVEASHLWSLLLKKVKCVCKLNLRMNLNQRALHSKPIHRVAIFLDHSGRNDKLVGLAVKHKKQISLKQEMPARKAKDKRTAREKSKLQRK